MKSWDNIERKTKGKKPKQIGKHGYGCQRQRHGTSDKDMDTYDKDMDANDKEMDANDKDMDANDKHMDANDKDLIWRTFTPTTRTRIRATRTWLPTNVKPNEKAQKTTTTSTTKRDDEHEDDEEDYVYEAMTAMKG